MLSLDLVEYLSCRGFLRLPGFRSLHPSSPLLPSVLCVLPSSFHVLYATRHRTLAGREEREDPFEDSSSLRPPLFLDIAPISLSLSVGRRPTKGQGDAKIRPVVLGRLVEMNWKNSPAKDVLGLFSASI